MTQDALREAIVATLTRLLGSSERRVLEVHEPISLAGRDLVGGVVALRGVWWGVVIVRCDRALANVLVDGPSQAMSTDGIMRRFALELAPVVAAHVDPSAKLSAPVALAADNATWHPSYAVLQLRVDVQVGTSRVVVEVQRRRRSDEVPTVDPPES